MSKEYGSLDSSFGIDDEIDAIQETETTTTSETATENVPEVPKNFFAVLMQYPKGVKYIIGNEACERFSFYGLKAILAIFLSTYLDYSEDTSTLIIHMFIFFGYFCAVPGGYIADVYLGKYYTIMSFGTVYVIGATFLAVFAVDAVAKSISFDNDPVFVGRLGNAVGLFLVAIGTGGIKACVSAMMGDQFASGQSHLIEHAFGVFYFSINAGSLLSTIVTPAIRAHIAPWLAFGLPAVLLMGAMIIFWLGRKSYRHVPPGGSILGTALKSYALGIRGFFCISKMRRFTFWEYARDEIDSKLVDDIKKTTRILLVFVPLPVFWALFDQHASRWVFQASSMKMPHLYFIELVPDQIPTLNPLFTLSLIPVFSGLIYPFFRRIGRPLKPLHHKMVIGMLITCFAFLASAALQYFIDRSEPNSINVAWQIPQYFLLSCAEVMVSVTGLEFAYSQAPVTMKSFVMAGWLMTVAVGNLLVAALAEVHWPKEDIWNYVFYATLMFIFDILFLLINFGYEYKDVIADDDIIAPIENEGEPDPEEVVEITDTKVL